MPKITVATVVKLLFASFIVGMLLAFLGLKPQELFRWLAALAAEIAADFRHWAGWALSYILTGAVVVVPLWLLSVLWKAMRSRR